MARFRIKISFFILLACHIIIESSANDILGCGGFVKSHVKLNFAEIEIGLYTKEGSLKEKTECAPTNGYYFLPLYEKGEYVLKVHPPAGLSFEPSEVPITVDGVTDRCATGQDINFVFNGFGINGRVNTQGQQLGPSGVSVQLVNEKGETRNTVTTVGGEFHFTAVIPGKYTVKASHPRWKIQPSQAEVQMKDGKIPVGVVLTVMGYDVKGSVSSFGSPIEGVYVLLYSKEENPKYRVEGCKTALLQGVPGSPICHSTTDSSGEFSFGLVPAGEYRLVALATTPGQVQVSYNVKPDAVPFTVRHDSLYIKNAFEVNGFTVVGSVEAQPGRGLSGVRVVLDGSPAGVSDATGKFTLPALHPGVYALSFQHEQCEFDDVQVSVSSSGPRGPVVGRVARWRVCGLVTPPGARRLSLRPERGPERTVRIGENDAGKWCTYLAPGVYTAKVEVSEQEQREGLQFYPLTQKVSVAHGPVDGITFSQLKGTLTGTVECQDEACEGITVTLRPLSPDGGYIGQPLTTVAVGGRFEFSEVVPGSVEVSVPAARLCWAEAQHNVAVTQARAAVPAFQHRGYVLRCHSTHAVQVEYTSKSSSGILTVPRGASQQCVSTADVYTLTPRGCHKFQPPQSTVDTSASAPTTVYFVAVAHAVSVSVTSPDDVTDLMLVVDKDGKGGEKVGPLKSTQDGGMFVYEHTLYMADGEVAVVSASSSSLLFLPSTPQQVVGGAECQRDALTLRALRGLTLAGRVSPPVRDVALTLSGEDGLISQIISSDGTYRFGPLDASKKYTITAEKESYVFTAPDDEGNIKAHKLAEIIVQLVDDADGTPLQGALVSVSGGTYRRNVVSSEGKLRFASLSPAEYYVKPNMKEYKFSPPHQILVVEEGRTHEVTLRARRVAWSWAGRLVSLGGQGWAGAPLVAQPRAHGRCLAEEATTEPSGAFRIRGLLPGCEYNIVLKDSSNPELAGLRIVKAPDTLQVVEGRDTSGALVVAAQPVQLTDACVRVRTALPDHYRALRLTLAHAPAPAAPVYSTRLHAPPSPLVNPGVMVVLPRLPADNRSYVVSLECSLSKATHSYTAPEHHFTSDGQFKYIDIDFQPKVKSSEQELRASSFLLIPLLGVLGLLYAQRARVLALVPLRRAARPARPPPRPDVLDAASIHHILNAVNPPAKKPKKRI